jgi:hypothetical protein
VPGSLSNSVAAGANTNAHTGKSDADTSVSLFVVPPAPVMPTGVSIGIIGVTDDDAAAIVLAPAAAIFIADQANVLNVARRYD